MAKTMRTKTLHDFPLTFPGHILQSPLPLTSPRPCLPATLDQRLLTPLPPCTSVGLMTLLMLLPSLWLWKAPSFLKTQVTHPLFHGAYPDVFPDSSALGPLHLSVLRTHFLKSLWGWLPLNACLSPKFTFLGRSSLTSSGKVANPQSTFISLCAVFFIPLTTV